MSGQIDLFTILTLVVAVVAVFQLRKVLGQRTGDEDERVERRRRIEEVREKEAAGTAPGKVVSLPRREAEEPPHPVNQDDIEPSAAEKIKTYAGSNSALADGLLAINKADSVFEPDGFLKGARQAYEMIVTAFAEGNRDVLRTLLNDTAMDDFSRAISEREKLGERVDQSFVGIKKADVLEAEVAKGVATVTVRFLSELISATRNRSGEVIDGDPSRVKEVTDIWTFSRDVSSARARRNPNWQLVATDAPN